MTARYEHTTDGPARGHLRLLQLYPRDMNIYGDWGNTLVLARRAQWQGYDVELLSYDPGDELPGDVDILGWWTVPAFLFPAAFALWGCRRVLAALALLQQLEKGVAALGLLDALDLDTDLTDAVVVVEWGEGVAERLSGRHLLVRLRRDLDTDERTVNYGWVTRG